MNGSKALAYYHGGMPGLRPGDVLNGGEARPVVSGCPYCEARAQGRAVVAGGHVIDGPSFRPDAVYVTPIRDYARYYASQWMDNEGRKGDLYTVEPVGSLFVSDEDHFVSYTCKSVVVLKVYRRHVTLTPGERRRLWRQWAIADANQTTP